MQVRDSYEPFKHYPQAYVPNLQNTKEDLMFTQEYPGIQSTEYHSQVMQPNMNSYHEVYESSEPKQNYMRMDQSNQAYYTSEYATHPSPFDGNNVQSRLSEQQYNYNCYMPSTETTHIAQPIPQHHVDSNTKYYSSVNTCIASEPPIQYTSNVPETRMRATSYTRSQEPSNYMPAAKESNSKSIAKKNTDTSSKSKANTLSVEDFSPFMLYYHENLTPKQFYEKTKRNATMQAKKVLIPVRHSKRNNSCCAGEALDYSVGGNIYSESINISKKAEHRQQYNDMLWSESDESDSKTEANNHCNELRSKAPIQRESGVHDVHKLKSHKGYSQAETSYSSATVSRQNHHLILDDAGIHAKNAYQKLSCGYILPIWKRMSACKTGSLLHTNRTHVTDNEIIQTKHMIDQKTTNTEKANDTQETVYIQKTKDIKPYIALLHPKNSAHLTRMDGMKTYYSELPMKLLEEQRLASTFRSKTRMARRILIQCC